MKKSGIPPTPSVSASILSKKTGSGAQLQKSSTKPSQLPLLETVGSNVAGKKRPFPSATDSTPQVQINGAFEPSAEGILSGFSILVIVNTFSTALVTVWKTNVTQKGAAFFAPSSSILPTSSSIRESKSADIEAWAKHQNIKLKRTLVIVLGDSLSESDVKEWSSYIGTFLHQPPPSSVHFVKRYWLELALDPSSSARIGEFTHHECKWIPAAKKTIPYTPFGEEIKQENNVPLRGFNFLKEEKPYSTRDKVNHEIMNDWVKSHCENLDELLRMGDDASRFGLNEKAPILHCPWTREELVWGYQGKNMALLRQFPFLDVAIPLVPQSALQSIDLTAGESKVNKWWCTRNREGEGIGAAGDVYSGQDNFVQYEPTSKDKFRSLESESPHSLGTCVYRSFVPPNHSSFSVPSSSKILALDIDGTLIKPLDSNLVHCNNTNDFQEAFPGAYKTVKLYYDKGFKIVLFTNQGGLLSAASSIQIVCNRIKQLADAIGVPLQVFISSGGVIDLYRKPYSGMFKLMISRCNGGLQVDMTKSLFIGDMAGRDAIGTKEKDKSCSDHQFAIVCGLRFKTPEEFFSPSKPQMEGVLRPLGAVKGENFNLHLTKPLAKLLPLYRARNKQFDKVPDSVRREALIRGLGNLSRLNYRVQTQKDAEELINLPCVGPKTVEKIKEILLNETSRELKGTFERLRQLENEGSGKYLCRAEMMECPYIGPKTAKSLSCCGIMTLEDVWNNKELLLNGNKKHHLPKLDARIFLHLDILSDLKQRVPRQESENVLALIREIVYDFAPGSIVIMGGSYRRGSSDSSDLDVIISGPKDKSKLAMDILRNLWYRLTNHECGNFLPRNISKTDYLTSTPIFEEQGSKLHMAIFKDCRNKDSKYRRIDLKICDYRFWVASLHAWTGNTQLNRIMKRYLGNLGYSLNDKTLARGDLKESSKCGGELRSTVENEKLEGLIAESEFDLFSFLGLRFIPPTERNVLAIYDAVGEAQQMANKASKPSHEDKDEVIHEDAVLENAFLGNHIDDFVPQDFIYFETADDKRKKEEAIKKCRANTAAGLKFVLEERAKGSGE